MSVNCFLITFILAVTKKTELFGNLVSKSSDTWDQVKCISIRHSPFFHSPFFTFTDLPYQISPHFSLNFIVSLCNYFSPSANYLSHLNLLITCHFLPHPHSSSLFICFFCSIPLVWRRVLYPKCMLPGLLSCSSTLYFTYSSICDLLCHHQHLLLEPNHWHIV